MECDHDGMCVCAYNARSDPFASPPEHNPEAWLIVTQIESSPEALAFEKAKNALLKFKIHVPHKSKEENLQKRRFLLAQVRTAADNFRHYAELCGWVFQ